MNTKVVTYLVYLAVSIGLTVWVARTLHKNGRAFLLDAFHQNEGLADSVNHLLVVGFYLINLGYVSLALKTGAAVDDAGEAIELLSWKVGLVLLVLGGMDFFNLYVFQKVVSKGARDGAVARGAERVRRWRPPRPAGSAGSAGRVRPAGAARATVARDPSARELKGRRDMRRLTVLYDPGCPLCCKAA